MSYVPKIYKKTGGDEKIVASGGKVSVESGGEIEVQSGGLLDAQSGAIVTGLVLNKRVRATTAEVNAGYSLLPAISGYKYRIVDMTMIAIGGSASGATSVDILATQGGSVVRPFVVAVAALTRSTAVKPNSANCTCLADGVAFVANDANTAITVSKQSAGSNLATATHVDVNLSYVIEAA